MSGPYPREVRWRIPSMARTTRYSRTHRTVDGLTTWCGRPVAEDHLLAPHMIGGRSAECRTCAARWATWWEARKAALREANAR